MITISDVDVTQIESQSLRDFLLSDLKFMSLPLAINLINENEGEDYFIDAGEDGFSDDYHTLLVSQEDVADFYQSNKAELLAFLNSYAVANAYKSGVDVLARLDVLHGFFDVFEIEEALGNSNSDSHGFIVCQLIQMASSALLNQYIDYMV